jgi:tRNA dimethylallyltransferase
MWEIGFFNEVKSLIEKYDVNQSTPSMRSVGYRQALEYLQQSDTNLISYEEMQLKALYATRQLAKRQYTWLNSLQKLHDFHNFYTISQGHKDLIKRFR